MKKAIITRYKSDYFPFMVTWTIGNSKYYNVFTTKTDCYNYIKYRFGNLAIIDKTK